MDGCLPTPLPAVSTATLIDRITELAGHLNAGTYRWLMLIAEFDRRAGWNCGLTKVRALTRVACAGTEAALLEMALHGTAGHVERLVREYRRVLEMAKLKREARQHRNRTLTWRYDESTGLAAVSRKCHHSRRFVQHWSLQEVEAGRDVAAPAHRAPVKGGGISTVALSLASPYETASLLDLCLNSWERTLLSA